MHNLIVFSPDRYDNGEYPEDASYDLSMFIHPVASLNNHEVAGTVAEDLRAKLGLTVNHRKAISAWLEHAGVGDTLLMPKEIAHGDTTQPDDIGMVLVSGSKPVVSRASIKKVERVETDIVVDVQTLTTGKKKVKKTKK